jgi:NADH dehydrogenase
LTNHALRALREHHVEVLLGTGVTAVEPNLVRLSTGETLATNTVVGSVGVQPNPLLSGLALPFDERGRIKVDDTLRVGGYSNVWALGDDASITDPNTGKPYPQTAQHAVRAARLLADNIAATIAGRPLEPMTYKTLGTMVALGHHNAVAQIGRFAMTGLLAWWIWRTYYLFQLPRWEKRLRVMFDWTLDLVAPPALVQLKVGQPAPMARRGTRDQGLGK